MGNNTCVIIKHNVNTTSVDSIISDLKQRLRKPLFIISFDGINNYPMDYPEKFKGWIVDLTCPDAVGYSFDAFFYQNDNNILIAGSRYMYLNDYCFDDGVNWGNIALWIDNINKKDSELYFKERNFLYETTKLFGGDSCIMFNDDALPFISNHIISGLTLEEALYKFEYEPITENLNKDYRIDLTVSRITSLGRIQILSPHSQENCKKLYGSKNWDYTIVIDDFRDLKMKERN